MNAKKITTIIGVLYLIGTTFLWIFCDKKDVDTMGKLLVIITYITTILITLVLKITNGNGINFKRGGFINPLDRAKVFKKSTPIVITLIIIGLFLSVVIYRNQNYMYDFITLVITLIISWNVVAILGDRIEQLNEKRK